MDIKVPTQSNIDICGMAILTRATGESDQFPVKTVRHYSISVHTFTPYKLQRHSEQLEIIKDLELGIG